MIKPNLKMFPPPQYSFTSPLSGQTDTIIFNDTICELERECYLGQAIWKWSDAKACNQSFWLPKRGCVLYSPFVNRMRDLIIKYNQILRTFKCKRMKKCTLEYISSKIYEEYSPLKSSDVYPEGYYDELGAYYEPEDEIVVLPPSRYIIQSDDTIVSSVRDRVRNFVIDNSITKWVMKDTILDREYVVKLVEDVCTLVYFMTKADGIPSYIVAIGNFVKLRTGKSLFNSTIYEGCQDMFMNIFELNNFTMQSEDDTDKFETIFKTLKKCLSNYDEVKKSALMQKLHTFCMYMMSLSVFDKVGLTMSRLGFAKLKQETIKQKYVMGVDFVYSMFDTLLFLCERGYQCIKTGSMDPIYHSGAGYEKWFMKCSDIKRKSLLMHDPETHGFKECDFLRDLHDVIEKGESIYKHATRIGDAERSSVRNFVNELKMIQSNELSTRKARENRNAPYALLLVGTSSVGKSTAQNVLFKHFAKKQGLPSDDCFRYTKNPIAKYWDGFLTSMWCLILDDIAYLSPNAAPTGDLSVMEIIQIMNNVCLVPDQAALQDKGRIPFRGKMCIASTNTIHLNAQFYFSCPLAVRRRLPNILEIRVKDEFKDTNGMLDYTKTGVINGEYPDFWIWTLHKITTIDHVSCKNEIDQVFYNIKDFLVWFNKSIENFDAMQLKVSESNKALDEVVLCDCGLPTYMCECEQFSLQATDEELFETKKQISVLCETISYYNAELLKTECSVSKLYIKRKLDENNKLLLSMESQYIKDMALIEAGIKERIIDMRTKAIEKEVDEKFAREIQNRKDMEQVDNYIDELMCVNRKTNYIERFLEFLKDLCFNMYMYIPFVACLFNFLFKYGGDRFRYYCRRIMSYVLNKSTKDVAYWKALGNKVYQNIGGNRTMLALGAVTSSILVTYSVCSKLYRTCNPMSQGGLEDIGRKPIQRFDGGNVWYKDDIRLSAFDLPRQSVGYKTQPDSFQKMILNSTCAIHCNFKRNGQDVMRPGKAVCVKGHVYMTNNHNLPDEGELSVEIMRSMREDGITSNIVVLMQQCQITRFPECDLAFFVVNNLPVGKDITNLFCENLLVGIHDGFYLTKDRNGGDSIRKIENIKNTSSILHPTHRSNFGYYTGVVKNLTENGDCGSIMIVNTHYGPAIGGLHALGADQGFVASICVKRKFVVDTCNLLEPVSVSMGVPVLSAKGAEREIGDIHFKSPVHFIEQGSAAIYGGFTGPIGSLKTRVEATIMQKRLLREKYSVKYYAPDVSSWKPWYLAMKDMINPVTKLNNRILQECKENFLNDILKGIAAEDLKDVHVYDVETAINGMPGLRFVDGINRASSAGAPWRCSKSNFIEKLEPNELYQDPITFSDEILDRVHDIISVYISGVRAMPVYTAHLKDEAVSEVKALLSKTRVFTGSPIDWSLVVRMYLLSVIRLIQKNRFVFESAPGVVAQSTEWEQIMEYLVYFGDDKIIAGDYGKFDKRMPPTVIKLCFDIIYDICKLSGYSEDDLRVVKGIAEDTAFPLVDFHGTLMEFFGSNPSGHPLTVIINGLANSLYMRYCYAMLSPNLSCKDFKKHVHLMTYGDDNIMGVSDVVKWFTHTNIQAVLHDVDIVYTMADKEAASIPYININQASFLKRRFLYDCDVDAYLCPLDHDSIEKMLMVWTKSNTICDKAQAIAIINSANREYFFYGKNVYESRQRLFKSVVKDLELGSYVDKSTFPSWEELVEAFRKASENVVLKRTVVLEDLNKNSIQSSPVSYSVLNQTSNQENEDGTCGSTERRGSRRHSGPNDIPSNCDWRTYINYNSCVNECACLECLSNLICRLQRVRAAAERNLDVKIQSEDEFVGDRFQIDYLGEDDDDHLIFYRIERAEDFVRWTTEPESECLVDTFLENEVSIVETPEYIEYRRYRNFINKVRRYDPEDIYNLYNKSLGLNDEYNYDMYMAVKNMECVSQCSSPVNYYIQSSDVTAEENLVLGGSSLASRETQQVLQFFDENKGCSEGEDGKRNLPMSADNVMLGSSLGAFLTRPVNIYSFTWAETDAVATIRQFNPWSLFFGDTRIANKLQNYAFIRCDLKIKVLINASPFYYGAMYLGYQPLIAISADTIATDGSNSFLIPYSQRPHTWLYPQSNEGCEMTLPYFFNQNALKVTLLSDFSNMGRLSFINYTTLQSANGAVGSGVTVQVYAWAENVELYGPTMGPAVQSTDEYVTHSNSLKPSALLAVAGRIIPDATISTFATATAAALDTMGYTNVPVVDDVMSYRPISCAPLATTEQGFGFEKLTVDNKNELTIDSGCVGLKTEDELNLSNLIQRESYITRATWSTTNAAADILFNSVVTPSMESYVAGTNQTIIQSTPMGYFANLFNFWHGDIIFRFKFIASPFHKGRVRIMFDPAGISAENLISDTVSSTVIFNQIVDLGKDTDVEVRIPYLQALPWLRITNQGGQAWSTSLSPAFLYNSASSNGNILIRVLTALSAPVASSNVPILVFVRAAENMEFANPGDELPGFSLFSVQSEDIVQHIVAGETKDLAKDRYLVNFGEAIISLRQVLRRMTLVDIRNIGTSAFTFGLWIRTMSKYPPSYGFDPFGIDTAKGLTATTTTFPFNFSKLQPMAYVQQCFIGSRGSVMWHFNVEDTGPSGAITIMRRPDLNATAGIAVKTQAGATASTIANFYAKNVPNYFSGGALTNQFTQAGLSASLPMYNNYKFVGANSALATQMPSSDGSGNDASQLIVSYNGNAGPLPANMKIWSWAGIGTDYSVQFFLNCPTYYLYIGTIVPV